MPLQMSPADQVVAVFTHPDDAEILAFGTLRRWRDTGATVTVVIVTHGANGVSISDHAAGIRLQTGDRLAESVTSYAGTGIRVECLDLEDGTLQADRRLVSAIEAALTRLACTVLIAHAVHAGNDHQDHHAVARAAVNAAARVATCTTILHPQPIAVHHSVDGVVLVDITDHLDTKITALQAHQSQAGRYYLQEPFTRHRAAAPGWAKLPFHAVAGRYFEAFTPSLILLDQSAKQS